MKHTFLCFVVALFCTTAYSQVTYKYQCSNTLKEKSGIGADLVPYCTGSYVSATPTHGPKRTVYQFDKGCGLAFSDSITNLLASGSYTIELYFKFDTVSGYKKIIDYNNLIGDKGFYNHNRKMNLYPNYTTADSPIVAGEWQYVAVTRDAASKKMYLYHNNKVTGSYNDTGSAYIYGTNKKLIFFKDDSGTSGEHSSGAVALIYITNMVLDSNTIKSRFSNIGITLGVQSTGAVSDKVHIYPNPSTGTTTITVPAKVNYTMSDYTGRIVMKNILEQGENNLSLHNLQPGLYFIRIEGEENDKVYKLIKQ